MDEEQALDNILVARAYTVDHLNNLLMYAAAKMYEETFALLIVDSIMAPFRVDYSGRGELCNFLFKFNSRKTASIGKNIIKVDKDC